MAEKSEEKKFVARNKKATFKYEIIEKVEAGIVLVGSEVKSLREARIALSDSYAKFRDDELYLVNCHISPYEMAGRAGHEPTRPRKLLLKKRELRKLQARMEEKGLTLVPLSVYFVRGLAKVELGVGRGKQFHDKRETLKKRDAEREMRRAAR